MTLYTLLLRLFFFLQLYTTEINQLKINILFSALLTNAKDVFSHGNVATRLPFKFKHMGTQSAIHLNFSATVPPHGRRKKKKYCFVNMHSKISVKSVIFDVAKV